MTTPPLPERITTHPGILSGKLIIAGTRMPVWILMELIELGQSNDEIVDDYHPYLKSEDVDAVRLLMETDPEHPLIRKPL